MQGLSLHQPWASLLAAKIKTIETRRWSTSYRGRLLICSTRRSPGGGRLDRADLFLDIQTVPRSVWISCEAARGVALAVAELWDVRPMESRDQLPACCRLSEGAYAWILLDIQALSQPFRLRGGQRLWRVGPALDARVRTALAS